MLVDEETSFKRWETENGVTVCPSECDMLYKCPGCKPVPEEYEDEKERKKKKVDPLRFRTARISALALLKMVTHAHSGGSLEVMGLMLGYAAADAIVVLDAFALPVEGTETRVDAGGDAQGYMVTYLEAAHRAGRRENVVGWYHSHPGYGCWLSGIDVGTQRLHQSYEDPYLAVVVDPVRTAAAGRVEVGAFRTYPAGYEPPESDGKDVSAKGVPRGKIEDFGVHHREYYALDVKVFKSSLDGVLLRSLWRSYWASTLCSFPRASADSAAQQIAAIAERMKQMCTKANAVSAPTSSNGAGAGKVKKSGKETAERILAEHDRGKCSAQAISASSSDAASVGQDSLCEMASLTVKARLFC